MPLKVDDEEKFGKLVKMWSTGDATRYFPAGTFEGDRAPPLPRTLDDLRKACTAIGLGITTEGLTSLVVIQGSPETLILRIPPKALIEKSETDLADGQYEIPKFYDDFFQARPQTGADKLVFHAQRVSDYTRGQCG